MKTAKAWIFKFFRALSAFAVFLASMPAVSATLYNNTSVQVDLINTDTKELNLDMLARMQAVSSINQFDLSQYIPLKNMPANDSNYVNVSTRILRQSLQTMFDPKNSTVAQSPAMQAANKYNTSFSPDYSAGHFSFKIQAAQTTAEVGYKGYVGAVLSYDPVMSQTKFEVSKAIGVQTLAFTHINNSDTRSDIVGLRWSF